MKTSVFCSTAPLGQGHGGGVVSYYEYIALKETTHLTKVLAPSFTDEVNNCQVINLNGHYPNNPFMYDYLCSLNVPHADIAFFNGAPFSSTVKAINPSKVIVDCPAHNLELSIEEFQKWLGKYPFAHMILKTDGANVLANYEEEHPKASLMAMNKRGQLTLPQEVIQALELFEYEAAFAARWFPAGRHVPIVIDPRYSAGQPSIPDRRLPINILYNRWKAGESMKYIASDYALPKNVVEEALRYAEKYVI